MFDFRSTQRNATLFHVSSFIVIYRPLWSSMYLGEKGDSMQHLSVILSFCPLLGLFLIYAILFIP